MGHCNQMSGDQVLKKANVGTKPSQLKELSPSQNSLGLGVEKIKRKREREREENSSLSAVTIELALVPFLSKREKFSK